MKKKKKSQIVFYIILGVALLTGVTYAFFNVLLLGTRDYSIEVSGVTFRYTEVSQGITLTDASIISDEEGIASTNYFDFSIYTEEENVPYTIYLKGNANNEINPVDIKVYLTDQNDNIVLAPQTIGSLEPFTDDTDSYALYSTSITATGTEGATHNYRLRMWLGSFEGVQYEQSGNSQTGSVGGTFSFKVNIAGS